MIERALTPLTGLLLCACSGAQPRYVMTARPVDILSTGHPGFCLAVDTKDTHGVSWWEPGSGSGCSTRATGPAIFPAEGATVEQLPNSEDMVVRFRLQLHVGYRDVRIVLQKALLEPRNDLNIPWAFGD